MADSTNGITPVSGAGTRMMWIPSKKAFRAGRVTSTQWDDANIGEYSFGFGLNSIASGVNSIAIGQGASANGTNSIAMGTGSSANFQAYAFGPSAKAVGSFSMAFGNLSVSDGVSSVVLGQGNRSKADYSLAAGAALIAQSAGGAVVGIWNDSANAGSISNFEGGNRIFQVGNGTALNRSNALTVLMNGKTGIGTTTPLGLLHVKNGAMLADGNIGATPVSGAGRRMMWVPERGAFRIGTIGENKPNLWDADSIGENSLAGGFNSVASGNTSTAIGGNAAATGNNAVALGQEVRASGTNSVAIGYYTKATGNASTAIGFNNLASGSVSTAFGYSTIASGNSSASFGYQSIASGYLSFATGRWVKAKNYAGTAIGQYNDTASIGNAENSIPENRLFQIGNGTADNARSNALTVLQNGNIGIGTPTPLSLLHIKNGAILADGTVGTIPITGAGRRMMWIPERGAFRSGTIGENKPNLWNLDSIGENSFAAGYNALASGNTSTAIGGNAAATGSNAMAFGNEVRASGTLSFAFGSETIASGHQATAMGVINHASGALSTAFGYSNLSSGLASTTFGSSNIASGNTSASLGYQNIASGSLSVAVGRSLKAKHYSGTVLGQYNDTTNSISPDNTHASNRLFQIGNGTADNARGNAMTVMQNGNIGIGEINPAVPLNFNSSTGAKISLWGTTGNQYGFGIQPSLLQIYTDVSNSDIAFGHGNSGSFTERMRIKGNGNVGIGHASPTVPLHFASTLGNKIALYAIGVNQYGLGIQDNLLQVYTPDLISDIAFGYGNSNSFTERVRIKGIGNMEIKSGLLVLGSVAVDGNLTVQNGKGIIRSAGTQPLKKVTTQVSVSTSINNSTGITANFTFSEAFSALPEAYVGNIVTNSSNGEYMVMTLTNLTSAGGTLNVYNPRSGGGFSNVNFTVNIIAMGPQ